MTEHRVIYISDTERSYRGVRFPWRGFAELEGQMAEIDRQFAEGAKARKVERAKGALETAIASLPTRATEQMLTNYVIELCRELGWLVVHFRPARTEKGWVTPVQGDGKGWPDICALKGGRIVVAELKAGRGKTTPEQEMWLDAWRTAGAEVYVWRTGDEEAIAEVLL